MVWTIEFDEQAKKELKQIDKKAQKNIIDFLKTRIATEESPYRFGEALKQNLAGLWKYRVGNYRIITEIQENIVTVIVLRVGHRSKIYGGH